MVPVEDQVAVPVVDSAPGQGPADRATVAQDQVARAPAMAAQETVVPVLARAAELGHPVVVLGRDREAPVARVPAQADRVDRAAAEAATAKAVRVLDRAVKAAAAEAALRIRDNRVGYSVLHS